MTEDMSRAKARVLTKWSDAYAYRRNGHIPGSSTPFDYWEICSMMRTREEGGWKNGLVITSGPNESAAWIDALRFLPTEQEAESGGVEQPLKCLNCNKPRSEHWERNDGFYCHTDGEELFRSEWKPKGAAPEAAGPADMVNVPQSIRDELAKLPALSLRAALLKGWALGLTPEPATEGAPETIAAEGRLDDRFTFQVRRDIPKDVVYAGTKAGAYLMLKFPSKPREPKAEGAEKAPNNHGLGEYFPEDCKHDELVVKLSDADTLFHALETRNAELKKELEIHKTRHHGLTDLQEVKAQLVWAEREVERLKADLQAMTIDRDLWQEGHAGDCPCACQLEAIQAEISSSEPPQSIANRYYLLGLQHTGPKYPEPCAPPYRAMEESNGN